MVRISIVLRALVMSEGSCPCAGAMHWAGHDRDPRAAQCGDPWREESYDKRNSDQAAHHDGKSTACHSRRNARKEARHNENQEPNTQLDRRRTIQPRRAHLIRQLGLHPPEIVCPDRDRNRH